MTLTTALHNLTIYPFKFAAPLGALLLASIFLPGTYAMAASTELLQLAQSRDSAPAASVFSPWSGDDVRQGARPKTDNPAPPQIQNKPQEAPKDVRRSSTPSSQAIPLFVRPPQTETTQANKNPVQSAASSAPAGEPAFNAAPAVPQRSFIKLQPFTDSDIRAGSRRP